MAPGAAAPSTVSTLAVPFSIPVPNVQLVEAVLPVVKSGMSWLLDTGTLTSEDTQPVGVWVATAV